MIWLLYNYQKINIPYDLRTKLSLFYHRVKRYLRGKNKNDKKARVSTYVNFAGNTEEALQFYRSVFQTEFINGIQRFGDIPADPNQPPVAAALRTWCFMQNYHCWAAIY